MEGWSFPLPFCGGEGGPCTPNDSSSSFFCEIGEFCSIGDIEGDTLLPVLGCKEHPFSVGVVAPSNNEGCITDSSVLSIDDRNELCAPGCIACFGLPGH